MRNPSATTLYILSFAVTLSLGALLGQDNTTPKSGNAQSSNSLGSGNTQSSNAQADSTRVGDAQAGNPSKTNSAAAGTSTRNRIPDVPDTTGELVGLSDQKFMMEAAKGSMMEVKLAQNAQQKASSDAVKELAKKIEQDHSQANKELMDLAKLKNVSLPADSATSPSSEKMTNMSGAGFDRAYVKAMVRDHKKDIKSFERVSTQGMDSDVKAFVAKTLPNLREHLRMAEELEKNPAKSAK